MMRIFLSLSLIWRRNGDAALETFVSHATRAFG